MHASYSHSVPYHYHNHHTNNLPLTYLSVIYIHTPTCIHLHTYTHTHIPLQEMDTNNIPKDTVTYSAAITACERCNEWPRAIELYASMKRVAVSSAAVRPNTYTLNAVLNACVHGRQWRSALEELARGKCYRGACVYLLICNSSECLFDMYACVYRGISGRREGLYFSNRLGLGVIDMTLCVRFIIQP